MCFEHFFLLLMDGSVQQNEARACMSCRAVLDFNYVFVRLAYASMRLCDGIVSFCLLRTNLNLCHFTYLTKLQKSQSRNMITDYIYTDTPDGYSSKLDANLCLSSTIIRSLWIILLQCHGGAPLVASCTRDTSHLDELFQLPF